MNNDKIQLVCLTSIIAIICCSIIKKLNDVEWFLMLFILIAQFATIIACLLPKYKKVAELPHRLLYISIIYGLICTSKPFLTLSQFMVIVVFASRLLKKGCIFKTAKGMSTSTQFDTADDLLLLVLYAFSYLRPYFICNISTPYKSIILFLTTYAVILKFKG
jgi:hypothetical protein